VTRRRLQKLDLNINRIMQYDKDCAFDSHAEKAVIPGCGGKSGSDGKLIPSIARYTPQAASSINTERLHNIDPQRGTFEFS
jgi:hypothetical protein